MRPITIQEVVDGLLSGDYQQTRSYLHDEYGFCCLGAAQDMAGCTWRELGAVLYISEFGDTVMVSESARNKMGEWGHFLNSADDQSHGDVAHVLADMNDGGATFAEIAQEIVRLANLRGYDVHLDRAALGGS